MKIKLALVVLALFMLWPATVGAEDEDLSAFAYQIPVRIINDSGAALDNTPIAVEMFPVNLTGGGYLQSDAADLRAANATGTDTQRLAQDIAQSSAYWYLDVDALADGSSGTWYFHMGNTTATGDQSWRFDGTTDTVTATDSADLDITTNLTLDLTDVNVFSIPSGETPLLEKADAYVIGLEDSDQIYTRVFGTATTQILRPDGAGTFTELTRIGCGANYECVNEAVVNDSNYVYTVSATFDRDTYTLDSWTHGSAVTISQIEVFFRSADEITAPTDGTIRPDFLLGGTTHNGSEQALTSSWVGYSDVIPRPGGGDWTATDLDTLQVGVSLKGNAGLSHIYVTVSYTPSAEATYSPIVTGTDYDIKTTYDGANLKLYVDGVEEDSTAFTEAIDTNANDLIIGAGINGYIGAANIGITDVASPTYVLTYDFEPDEVAQTQQGDGDNSWVWLGTVEDVSAGGSDNDGAYSQTRDFTGLTIYAQGLEIKALPADATVEEQIQEVLGTTGVSGSDTEPTVEFPFRGFFDDVVDNPNWGTLPIAFWMIPLVIGGFMVTITVYAATKNELMAMISLIGILALGWKFSLVPLWVPLVTALVGISVTTFVKRWSTE